VKHYPLRAGLLSKRSGAVRAVDGVSFAICRGETLGLVGESGCGKSTVARLVLRLEKPTAGRVLFDGTDLLSLASGALRAKRRELQIVFQDPMGSLNPRMTVGEILAEPLRVHRVASGRELDARVALLLEQVGIPASWRSRYPHEFSGGQRQRIGVARAIALGPKLVVCDEAVSALDVSVQAQVLNLLLELRERLGLAYLFISHDLSVVRHISDRVAVMYLGKMVELADRNALYEDPLHPYTRALLSAVPIPDPRLEAKRERTVLRGEVPSPLNPPSGCVFHPRCPIAVDRCSAEVPPLREIRPGHWAACHLA